MQLISDHHSGRLGLLKNSWVRLSLLLVLFASGAFGHGVAGEDKAFLQQIQRYTSDPFCLSRRKAYGHWVRSPLVLVWSDLLPVPAA